MSHFKFTYVFILLVPIVFLSSFSFASEKRDIIITCGNNTISGVLELEDPENTEFTVTLTPNNNDADIEELAVSFEDNVYLITINPTEYEVEEYLLEITASMNEQKDVWSKEIMLGTKDCNTIQELEEKIETYTETVEEFFENNKEVQQIPSEFLKTGLTEYLVESVKEAGQKFVSSKSKIYYDVPGRSFTPDDVKNVNFYTHYELLPSEHKGAYAYFRYQGLLIPIQTTESNMSETNLLSLLNNGSILAPETTSLDELGVVKMLYNHAVSTIPSPFSGVGSHMSVFSEIGDTLELYVLVEGTTSYEQRTYTLQRKLEIAPDQTHIITSFKKKGADLLAFISCKDGEILGSTEGREVLFFSRLVDEINSFQKSVITVAEDPMLADMIEQLDGYLSERQFTEEEANILVAKLEDIEAGPDKQLKIVATYAKYMTSYNSKYN